MNRNRVWACVVLSLALVPLCAARAEERATRPVVSGAQIESILKDRVDLYQHGVGIVVGVIDAEGRRVFSYGELRRGEHQRPDGDTIFEIGSITKVFTTTVLADMVARGEVTLDEPVAKLLPETVHVPERGGAITLEHLATHSSGLPRLPDNLTPADVSNPYADYTVEQLYAFLSGYQLPRDVGATVEYSNLGVGLLGVALARRAGSDYESLVKARITGPLGMKDTTITLTPAQQQRFATGYGVDLQPTSHWDIPTLAGAGALRSTANDMLTFLAANLGLVESPLAAAMAEASRPRRDSGLPDMEMGLAWLTRKGAHSEIVWHNGGTGGFHSFIGFDRHQGRGVVVLANCAHNIDDIGFHLLDASIPLAELQAPSEVAKLPEAVLEEYVGRYQLAPGFILTVTRDGDALWIQATGQGKAQVYPKSRDEFFYQVVDAQVSFGRDGQGKVDHLVLHQGGADQKAAKLAPGQDQAQFGPAESMTLPEEVLERYVGRYQLAPSVVLTVTREGQHLYAQVTGQPRFEVFASSETEFFWRVVDARLTFEPGPEGPAKQVTLHQGGRDLPGPRLE